MLEVWRQWQIWGVIWLWENYMTNTNTNTNTVTNMRWCDLIVGWESEVWEGRNCRALTLADILWLLPPPAELTFSLQRTNQERKKAKKRCTKSGRVRRGGQGLCRRSFTRWGFKLAKIVQGELSNQQKLKKKANNSNVKYSQFSFHSQSCESEMWNVLR